MRSRFDKQLRMFTPRLPFLSATKPRIMLSEAALGTSKGAEAVG